MDLQMNGKLALVSGSTAGIGHAIAHRLAAEGADVILNGRTQAGVDEAVERIRADARGWVHGFAGDLRQAKRRKKLCAATPASPSWSTTSVFSSPRRSRTSRTKTGSASSTSTS